MPFPASMFELERALAEALLARAGPHGEPWADMADRLDAARQVAEKYRSDPAGRPWRVERWCWTESPSSAPDADASAGRILFAVARGEREVLTGEDDGYGRQKFVTVAWGDRVRAVYESPSPEKASAVAQALNELEEER